jgi:hypothetical protein
MISEFMIGTLVLFFTVFVALLHGKHISIVGTFVKS